MLVSSYPHPIPLPLWRARANTAVSFERSKAKQKRYVLFPRDAVPNASALALRVREQAHYHQAVFNPALA